MNTLSNQTITLAAICQAATLVQNIARENITDEAQHQADFQTLLSSIIITSPDNTLDVYGNELVNLKTGLQSLITQLGDQTKDKDPELTRYIVNLISLERRLSRKKAQLAKLADRIEQCKRQVAHYDITSETLISSLASVYSDLLSPLGTPIQVAGKPEILKQANNQHKIRALLLAGIRSSVLWRQVGGKRRNILFARGKIVACAQQLLTQI